MLSERAFQEKKGTVFSGEAKRASLPFSIEKTSKQIAKNYFYFGHWLQVLSKNKVQKTKVMKYYWEQEEISSEKERSYKNFISRFEQDETLRYLETKTRQESFIEVWLTSSNLKFYPNQVSPFRQIFEKLQLFQVHSYTMQ